MGAIQTNQRENEALFASILPEFFDYVKRNSDEVNTIEVARSLDGIYSLPAYFQSGGVEKIVLAPISLLTKNIDALIADCRAATQSANAAAQAADASAARITTAIQELTALHDEVVAATELCSDMTDAANEAKERCDTAYAQCVQASADALRPRHRSPGSPRPSSRSQRFPRDACWSASSHRRSLRYPRS